MYGGRFCAVKTPSPGGHEHRLDCVVERLEQLPEVFAIDVAAYAVMSNHAHLVVRVDAERAQGWSQEEVLRRWTRLYVGPELVQRYLRDGEAGLSAAQREGLYTGLNPANPGAATYRSRAVHCHHRPDAPAVQHRHRYTGAPHRALRDAQHRLPARHERSADAVRAEGGLIPQVAGSVSGYTGKLQSALIRPDRTGPCRAP